MATIEVWAPSLLGPFFLPIILCWYFTQGPLPFKASSHLLYFSFTSSTLIRDVFLTLGLIILGRKQNILNNLSTLASQDSASVTWAA